MKVGDLVRHDQGYIGIIIDTFDDTKEIVEVEVFWNDGEVCNMSIYDLEVIDESG